MVGQPRRLDMMGLLKSDVMGSFVLAEFVVGRMGIA